MLNSVFERVREHFEDSVSSEKAFGKSVFFCDAAIILNFIFLGYLLYTEKYIPVAIPWSYFISCPIALLAIGIMRVRLEIIYWMFRACRVSRTAFNTLVNTGSVMMVLATILMTFFAGFLGNRLSFYFSIFILACVFSCVFYAMFVPRDTAGEQEDVYKRYLDYADKAPSIRFIPPGMRKSVSDAIWDYL